MTGRKWKRCWTRTKARLALSRPWEALMDDLHTFRVDAAQIRANAKAGRYRGITNATIKAETLHAVKTGVITDQQNIFKDDA